MEPPQTTEQKADAYQLYQQQMQQYQQQLQQYQQYQQLQQYQQQNQFPTTQQTTQQPTATVTPSQVPQYAYFPPTQYPQQQYMQQPYQPQQYQNRGYQNNAQHSDRVLWVGNLHQDVNDNELREVFQGYGTIENIKLVHTKACAFIAFTEAQAATRAHSEMNHQQIHGQEIKIGWGKAENSQGGFGQQHGGNAGVDNQQHSHLPDVNKELPQMSPSRALWVGNVTNSITEATLREVFSRCGNVENVRMMVQKNCAFVTYATVEEATTAKSSLDKYRIADTQIKVNYGKV